MVFLSPAKKDAPTETMQKIKVGRGWSSKQGSGKAHPSLPGRLLEAKNVDGDKKVIPASKEVPTRAVPLKPSTSC